MLKPVLIFARSIIARCIVAGRAVTTAGRAETTARAGDGLRPGWICLRPFCKVVVHSYRSFLFAHNSEVQCSAVQCSAVHCSAVQYSTVQYSTVQYSTVQYSTVQCSAVQYRQYPAGTQPVPSRYPAGGEDGDVMDG